MADHPDIALVKKGYEAFNSADIATLSELNDTTSDLGVYDKNWA